MLRSRIRRLFSQAVRAPQCSTRLTVQRLEERDTPASLAPTVEINHGEAQRSVVTSLTVHFDGDVRFVGGKENLADAFKLRGPSGPVVLSIDQVSRRTPGQTVVTLTFSKAGVTDGSLDDGDYTLTIKGGQVIDAAGNLFDGDGDGLPGGNATTNFHRLFGDVNGDRAVDNLDLFQLRGAYGKKSADAGYLAGFDSDSDGDVDNYDVFRIFQCFGTTLAPRPA
jgi:hypothetical protein